MSLIHVFYAVTPAAAAAAVMFWLLVYSPSPTVTDPLQGCIQLQLILAKAFHRYIMLCPVYQLHCGLIANITLQLARSKTNMIGEGRSRLWLGCDGNLVML